jgi:hypothetical protein
VNPGGTGRSGMVRSGQSIEQVFDILSVGCDTPRRNPPPPG